MTPIREPIFEKLKANQLPIHYGTQKYLKKFNYSTKKSFKLLNYTIIKKKEIKLQKKLSYYQ
jgi:hypothetical protein